MGEGTRKLELLPGVFAVCRLDNNAGLPDWAMNGLFFSITRTAEELSVVCPDAQVAPGVQKETGWRVLMVRGPLDFCLTGVLASLVGPLAGKGISIFSLSTFDTDYVMVKHEQLKEAIRTLESAGYDVQGACE